MPQRGPGNINLNYTLSSYALGNEGTGKQAGSGVESSEGAMQNLKCKTESRFEVMMKMDKIHMEECYVVPIELVLLRTSRSIDSFVSSY